MNRTGKNGREEEEREEAAEGMHGELRNREGRKQCRRSEERMKRMGMVRQGGEQRKGYIFFVTTTVIVYHPRALSKAGGTNHTKKKTRKK